VVRRASQHAWPSHRRRPALLIAHIGAPHARASGSRAGGGGDCWPKPRAADDRRAVRHAGGECTRNRIDPGGLGRAPGSDQNTMYALRPANPGSGGRRFPRTSQSSRATSPGTPSCPASTPFRAKASRVFPLYILGSSTVWSEVGRGVRSPLRGFASHFAPAAAGTRRSPPTRTDFRASETAGANPYVIAGVNVVRGRHNQRGRDAAAGHPAQTSHQPLRTATRDQKTLDMTRRAGRPAARRPGAAAQVDEMLTYTAAGTPAPGARLP